MFSTGCFKCCSICIVLSILFSLNDYHYLSKNCKQIFRRLMTCTPKLILAITKLSVISPQKVKEFQDYHFVLRKRD